MIWPSQGIHEGVPFATYRACDITPEDNAATIQGKSISKSLITSFAPNPGAWKISPPKKQTAAMKGGSLFDCLLTAPEEMESRYQVSPFDSFRTNEAKAWRDEMESTGVEVITQDKLDAAKEQFAAVMSNPDAAKLIFGSRKQVAFRHRTSYPFWSKGLIDIVPECGEVLVDIKTCEPRALESHRELQKHIYKWSYHVQAGAYCEGWSTASGEEVSRFKFIFVSSAAPYITAVVELPLAAILFGAEQYRAGAKRFAACMETGKWPGIWDGETLLDLPEYAYLEGGEP